MYRLIFHVDKNAFLGSFAELRKTTINFVMSVRPSICPHGTTRLSMDRFSWTLIFAYFSKICREYSGFINPLTTKLYPSDLKTQFVPRSKHCVGYKNKQVNVVKEIIAVCSEFHANTKMHCGQNTQFF